MGRLQAMHLARRLPAGSYVEATWAGLQDTAPRAALLSLHARMEAVGPDGWEHDSLVQVWGPRQAVWLIHRDAVAAFTLGRLPRDATARARIDALADEVLAGGGRPGARAGAMTGRFLLRWDARTTTVIPAAPPDVDVEDARRELAGRFLDWFGDEMRPAFAAWAGVAPADAQETLAGLPSRRLPGRPAATGVRLLPLFDPYRYGEKPPAPHHQVVGIVLVRGRPGGRWRRQDRSIRLDLDDRADTAAVVAEAERMSQPLGGAVTVTVTA